MRTFLRTGKIKRNRRVGGVGSYNAPCAWLGEALGKDEESYGEPFVGAAGKFLFHGLDWSGPTRFPGLEALGLPRDAMRIDNVVEMRPRENSLLHLSPAVVARWQRDWWENRAPKLGNGVNVIAACGNLALNTLNRAPLPINPRTGRWKLKSTPTGPTIAWRDQITNWRGSIFNIKFDNGEKLKCLPVIHPASIIRGSSFFDAWQGDLERLVEDSEFPQLRLFPNPEILIDPTERDCWDFVHDVEREWQKHRMESVLACDIETVRRSIVDIIGFSIDPKFAFVLNTDSQFAWRIASLLLRHPIPKGWHYGIFDTYVLRRTKGLTINRPLHWDSQLIHHCLDPRDQHRLAYCASRDLRVRFWKHERDKEDEASLAVKEPGKRKRYCLEDSTPVLRADCTWAPIGTLNVGDKLLAVDEFGGNQAQQQEARKWRVATVKAVYRFDRPVYRITMHSGRTLIATKEHKFLVGRSARNWRRVDALRASPPRPSWLNCAVAPWDSTPISAFERGWLGGILDGEGCLSGVQNRGKSPMSTFGRLSIAQKPGLVLDRVRELLTTCGFRTRTEVPSGERTSASIHIKGGLAETIRALGLFRPLRLRRNLRAIFARGFTRAVGLQADRVVRIEKIGVRPVVDITTTTGTFIANGYVAHNCGKDVTYTRALIGGRDSGYIQRIGERGMRVFYQNHYRKLGEACLRMSLAGFRVDATARKEIYSREDVIEKGLKEKIRALAGDVWGPKGGQSSPKVAAYFYDKLGCKPFTKRGTGKRTADELAIRKLMRRYKKARPGALLLLAERQHSKIKKEVRAVLVDDDGRMRSRFTPTAKTGRLRSGKDSLGKGVNLQNRDQHSDLRRMFVADRGHVLVELDEGQAEDRIVDGKSGDKRLLRDVGSIAIDRHIMNASRIFNVPYDTLLALYKAGNPDAKEKRQLGKKTRHAVNYGMGGARMAEVALVESEGALVLDPEECEEWIDALKLAMPGIVRFHEWVDEEIATVGSLTDSWGWTLFFKGLRTSYEDRKEGYAWHGSGEVAKIMNRLGVCVADEKIYKTGEWEGAKIVQQGHDSIVLTTPPELAWKIATTLYESINQERVYPGAGGSWRLKMPCGIKVALDWKGTRGAEWKTCPAKDVFQDRVRSLCR